MPTCGTCRRDLPDESFSRKQGRLRQYQCKACAAAYARKHYLSNGAAYLARNEQRIERNRQFIVKTLEGRACVDCGEDDIVVLQFDHRGDKVMEVSKAMASGWSVARLAAEIAKCDIRCANCHVRRTAQAAGFYRVGAAARLERARAGSRPAVLPLDDAAVSG